jgi:D-amino-acid oxidase
MRVQVIGGGIVGMTVALAVREAGHDVALVSADEPAQTTSSVAAALWYPYLALPREDVTRWAAVSYRRFAELADHPQAGVRMRAGREIFRAVAPDPWWADAVPSWRRLTAAELPAGYADGLGLIAPVIDMSRHLPWLAGELLAAGVSIERRRVHAISHAGSDVVVNCAGLGARELAGDDSVYPVRGQIVVLAQTGVDEWLLDDGDPTSQVPMTYVVPRLDTVAVGGTADAHAEHREPDPVVAEAILVRARALVPALADAAVLEHRVGLRPARPSVRLESEDLPTGRVVHCYGHGGAGVTLSYGCAEDVVALLGSDQ